MAVVRVDREVRDRLDEIRAERGYRNYSDPIRDALTDYGSDERFRIYVRDLSEPRGFRLMATCATASAVGVALVTLAEDRWEAGDRSAPVVGVLDGERRRWVSGMWLAGER